MAERKELLAEAYKNGTFLDVVQEHARVHRAERNALAAELTALHNDGQIDLVSAFSSLTRTSQGHDFFMMRHVFEEALPQISAPVADVMSCVYALYKGAGEDMAKGSVLGAFVSFCEKEAARPEKALGLVLAKHDLIDFLTPTLLAGSRIDSASYMQKAVELAGDDTASIRQRAIYAIGRVEWPNAAILPENVFAALEKVLTGDDADILGAVVKTCAALLEKDASQETRLIDLMERALAAGGERALHAAADVFAYDAQKLSPIAVATIVRHLPRVNPKNKDTLDRIDDGISRLIGSGNSAQAFEILEELLLAHPGELSLDIFNGAASDIRENKSFLNKIATRWLLRGERVLCEGVYELTGAGHGANVPIDVDPDELKPPDGMRVIFVAHKAIGYLFFNPVSAASAIVSLMHHTKDKEVLAHLGECLFDPLLLNYPGKARDYVQDRTATEIADVKAELQKVLKNLEDYFAGLEGAGELAELHPAESQRQAHHRRFSQQMAESFKKARSESVFLNLFPQVVLLYGRKSINYVYGPGPEPKRVEIPLTGHSVAMEFPRAERIDPFGLEYTLRVFRAEQFKS